MASTITRPTTFNFRLASPSPPKPKTQFATSIITPKTHKIFSLQIPSKASYAMHSRLRTPNIDIRFKYCSFYKKLGQFYFFVISNITEITVLVDIPNYNLSPSNRPNLTPKSVDVSKEDKPISEQPNSGEPNSSESEKIDKRRLEEKFAVLNTGIYECRSCGYRYDEAAGDPTYPIPPGLPFGQLPEDWRCPTCGAAKSVFESKSVEIAGFAQNQQFGLGGNSLTSGQKAVLIYGTLFFFFVLFLSGYFLQ